MATTNFVSGTLIESTWLNDVDAHVYDQGTGAHTAANIAVVDTAGNFTATDVEGVLAELATGGSGLQYFTEGLSVAAPNATVPVHSLTASGAETNIDAALSPKGTGALTSHIADNTATGGNKRGEYSTDLQRYRTAATMVASGYGSFCVGVQNTASSIYSIAGGRNNVSSGLSSVVFGNTNAASGNYSFAHGQGCFAIGGYSIAIGLSCSTEGQHSFAHGQYAADRGIDGKSVYANGRFSVTGDSQVGVQVLQHTTTDATPKVLTVNSQSVLNGLVSVLPDNYSYVVSALVIARNTSTGDTATWKVEGAIKRGANAAATALVGAPTVTSLGADAGMATAAVALIADTTLGAAEIQVTGIAATTINWVCKFDTVEVG